MSMQSSKIRTVKKTVLNDESHLETKDNHDTEPEPEPEPDPEPDYNPYYRYTCDKCKVVFLYKNLTLHKCY